MTEATELERRIALVFAGVVDGEYGHEAAHRAISEAFDRFRRKGRTR
jgi:hypothetical protein